MNLEDAHSTPATAMSYRSGETVAGKYRLLELLGEGGMGTVWRAHYETLHVDVALKMVLRPNARDDELPNDGRRRLQLEACAAARLGHAAIARVYDYGLCSRGGAFIVMELLEGEDLGRALARRGQLSASKAVATLLPIVHALCVAHQKGVVHRDIKPQNIYLARTADGRVQPKLLDFGIAKLENPNTRLTRTGALLGSPVYVSPEQARGEEVDARSDVWSTCIVLYELIAGAPPFGNTTPTGLLYAILARDPPSLFDAGLADEALWKIVERGLAKEPHHRWSTMRELGQELARWLSGCGKATDITGASLCQQWFQCVDADADLLASLTPPPLVASDDARPKLELPMPRVSDVITRADLEEEPEESTLAGGVLFVPATTVRGRVAALSLGCVAAVTFAAAVSAVYRLAQPLPAAGFASARIELRTASSASTRPLVPTPWRSTGTAGEVVVAPASDVNDPLADAESVRASGSDASNAPSGSTSAKPATSAESQAER